MLVALVLLAFPTLSDTAALEKELADRPLEAFALVRRAADRLSKAEHDTLLAKAARIQERYLQRLNEDQVQELADVVGKNLDDKPKAESLRREWLKGKREALGPADAPGRVRLAEVVLRSFQDRPTAIALCLEAARIEPDLPAVKALLRDRLEYVQTENGWQPKAQVEPFDRTRGWAKVRVGMTPAEVRALLGQPDRVGRQVLDGRYLEQWVYLEPLLGWVEFQCVKGKEPFVQRMQPPPK